MKNKRKVVKKKIKPTVKRRDKNYHLIRLNLALSSIVFMLDKICTRLEMIANIKKFDYAIEKVNSPEDDGEIEMPLEVIHS